MKDPKELLTVKVPTLLTTAENERVERIAKAQKRSRSYILRTAFQFYCQSHEIQ